MDEERMEKGRGRNAPRWTIPFLRALARTGDVRAAAEDAGIDHTTAYARRKTHADFAGLWRGALAANERWRELKQEEELRSVRPASPAPGSPRGAQIRRDGHGRWSQTKEKLFFDELAATANVKRAAAAAGVSTNAVYARRMKQPVFRAKWDAVLETGRAAIEMKLVEAANRTFEPEEIDTAEVEPKVSVAEAIRIVQLHGSRKPKQDTIPDPFAEQAASMSEDEIAEVRERIIRKLRRLRERDMPDMIARGWSFDEEHEQMVPPGWVRADSAGAD
jgi:hypothetical protein